MVEILINLIDNIDKNDGGINNFNQNESYDDIRFDLKVIYKGRNSRALFLRI